MSDNQPDRSNTTVPDVPPDVTIVSRLEYGRLEECTRNPEPPTQAVLEGAELLSNLRRRRCDHE